METEQVQLIINELKAQNPQVSPGILRETVEYAIRMAQKATPADEASRLVYPSIFYASVQSFLNGYAAFVDGDYNEAETELDPDIPDETVRKALLEFSEILPSHMIARASHHVAVLMIAQPDEITALLGNAVPAIAGNGFLTGFSAAQNDMRNGKHVRDALPPVDNEQCIQAACWAMTASGLDPSTSECVVKFTADNCAKMASAKIATHSGVSRLEPDGLRECMDVYALGYVNGLVNSLSAEKSGKFELLSQNDTPYGMETAEAEVRAWCRQRKYPDDLIDATLSACRAVHEEGNGSHPDGGAFMLTGWGYADGLAEIFDFSDDQDAIAAELRRIFAAVKL